MIKKHYIQIPGINHDQKLEKVYVTRVYDGDTFRTADGENVRLIGVDTPEINHEEGTAEYYGREALAYARKHLEGKYVYLEYDQDRRDKYGRLLAYVFLTDGIFFNASLLEEGYAHLITVPPNIKYLSLFKKTVKKARGEGAGIWSRLKVKEASLPVIGWEEAENYIGKEVIVRGQIVDTYNSGQALFLNFDREYWRTFRVVIFSEDLNKFGFNPEEYFDNKCIKVMGKVKEYEGKPEIIVDSPEEIMVIKNCL